MRAEYNPVRKARRETELRERLGSETPRCIYCGCAELPLLMRNKRPLLEEHHVAGASHDPALTVLACRNCHAMFHENALDAGVILKPASNPVIRGVQWLDSVAIHFEMFADAARRLAAQLRKARK